jgi:MFS superfamily sulfate permease-like transporter
MTNLRQHAKSSSIVMLATLVVTLFTYDLAMGVLMGGLLSGFFFAHKFFGASLASPRGLMQRGC